MVAVVIEICIDKFRLQQLVGGKISNYFINPQKTQIKIIQPPLTNSQRLKMDNTVLTSAAHILKLERYRED